MERREDTYKKLRRDARESLKPPKEGENISVYTAFYSNDDDIVPVTLESIYKATKYIKESLKNNRSNTENRLVYLVAIDREVFVTDSEFMAVRFVYHIYLITKESLRDGIHIHAWETFADAYAEALNMKEPYSDNVYSENPDPFAKKENQNRQHTKAEIFENKINYFKEHKHLFNDRQVEFLESIYNQYKEGLDRLTQRQVRFFNRIIDCIWSKEMFQKQ